MPLTVWPAPLRRSPDWSKRFPGVRLICRHGKPCELDDLKKLSLHAARHVVVLGCGAKPGLADSHTITIVCVRAARPCLQNKTTATG